MSIVERAPPIRSYTLWYYSTVYYEASYLFRYPTTSREGYVWSGDTLEGEYLEGLVNMGHKRVGW